MQDAGSTIRDAGSIPQLGRSPEEEQSNPLQYSGLENHTDREACQATVHGVAKSRTGLKQVSTSHFKTSMNKRQNNKIKSQCTHFTGDRKHI